MLRPPEHYYEHFQRGSGRVSFAGKITLLAEAGRGYADLSMRFPLVPSGAEETPGGQYH